MKVCIAEKPSVAKEIAYVIGACLCGKRQDEAKRGCGEKVLCRKKGHSVVLVGYIEVVKSRSSINQSRFMASESDLDGAEPFP